MRRNCGSVLGSIFFLFKWRSGIINQNLEFAYHGHSSDRIALRKNIFRSAYQHFGQLVFEIIMLFGSMKYYVEHYSRLYGFENLLKAKKNGKGVVFLSSHVGNWEIMAARGALSGMDLMIVTKHLKPEWLHHAVESGRKKCFVSGAYEPKTMRSILSHLKKNGTVGIVLDQYAGPPIGVRVPFFGVPVGTSTALAMIVKRTGAIVLPVVNYRTTSGGVNVEIQPALEWESGGNQAEELAINTALYVSVLEQHICRYPEQWLWIHRRFKGDLSPLHENEWTEGRSRN